MWYIILIEKELRGNTEETKICMRDARRKKSDFSSLSLSAEYRWILGNYLAVPSPLRILWGCKRQLCLKHYANIKSHLLGTGVKSCHAEEQGSWRTAPVNNQANTNYTVWRAGPGTSIPSLMHTQQRTEQGTGKLPYFSWCAQMSDQVWHSHWSTAKSVIVERSVTRIVHVTRT